MSDRLTEEFVRSELAKEGWVLVDGWQSTISQLTIYNPEMFDGHYCRFTYFHWKENKRPNMRSLINPTEYVRACFAKRGWTLLSEYKHNEQNLFITNPDYYEGELCQITWHTFSGGADITFNAIVDKTEYVRKQLAKEGWILTNKYIDSGKLLYMYNKDKFDGCLCQMKWMVWAQGSRPLIKSLVDPQGYVRNRMLKEGWELLSEYRKTTDKLEIRHIETGEIHQVTWRGWYEKGVRPRNKHFVLTTEYVANYLKQDGWELLNEYNGSDQYLHIRKNSEFNGHICTTLWSNYKNGVRPSFVSVLNKTEYIREQVAEYGWELLNEYTGAKEYLHLRNNEKFLGFAYKVKWSDWKNDKYAKNVRLPSLVGVEDYIKTFVGEYGYVLIKENWVYSTGEESIELLHTPSGKIYNIPVNDISREMLPHTPKYRIRNILGSFYIRKKLKKPFYTSRLLPQQYWDELNKKFPSILPGQALDHIVPLSWYGNTAEQMLVANHPRNFRLLTIKENISRGNRLRASELDEYDLWDLYYQAENPDCYDLIEDRDALAS